MKSRSLSGNVGIGFFVLGLIFIVIAFATRSWFVTDYRITGAELDRIGLWTRCFRSSSDQQDLYQNRFFIGCLWIYDPFTTGYDNIRIRQVKPSFMVATQFFFTLTFVLVIVGAMVLLYFLCCGPDQKKYNLLIKAIAIIHLVGGLSGGLAVIIFAACANRSGWFPAHGNNFFGWSFILAAIGSISLIISSILFFVDENIQRLKKRLLKESETRFEMEHKSKA